MQDEKNNKTKKEEEQEEDYNPQEQPALWHALYKTLFVRSRSNMFDFSHGQLPGDIIEVIYKDYLSPVDHVYLDMTCTTANALRPDDLTDIPFFLIEILTKIATAGCDEYTPMNITLFDNPIKMRHFTLDVLDKCQFVGWNVDTGSPDLYLTRKPLHRLPLTLNQPIGDDINIEVNNQKCRAFNLILAVVMSPDILLHVSDYITENVDPYLHHFILYYFQAVRLYYGLSTTQLRKDIFNFKSKYINKSYKDYKSPKIFPHSEPQRDYWRKILISTWTKRMLNYNYHRRSTLFFEYRLYSCCDRYIEFAYGYLIRMKVSFSDIKDIMKFLGETIDQRFPRIVCYSGILYDNEKYHNMTLMDKSSVHQYIEDLDYAIETFRIPSERLYKHLIANVYNKDILMYYIPGKTNGHKPVIEDFRDQPTLIFIEQSIDEYVLKLDWLLNYTSYSVQTVGLFFLCLKCHYNEVIHDTPKRNQQSSKLMRALITCLLKNKTIPYIKEVKDSWRQTDWYNYINE